MRRQLTINASCMVRRSTLENTDHVLRFCTPSMATWLSVTKMEMRHEIFNLSLEEWFVKNLYHPEYFACIPSTWVTLFGSIY